jgi:hypothetical protein
VDVERAGKYESSRPTGFQQVGETFWPSRTWLAEFAAVVAKMREPVEPTSDPMEQMRRMAEDLRQPD